MNVYRLYNEWRGISIFGESLEDALMRKKELQMADRFFKATGDMTTNKEQGAILTISKILGIKDGARGNDKCLTALVEFSDSQIKEVDAKEMKW
jgi:hypothetical protein